MTDLTRNVVVRSSGTDTTANAAYIDSLVQNATSFSLVYGEFAYLGQNGANASLWGLTLDGVNARGFISSSTIRDGYMGVNLNGASNNTISNNVLSKNAWANIFVGNNSLGIIAKNNLITANDIQSSPETSGSSGGIGIYMNAGYYNTFSLNAIYSNNSGNPFGGLSLVNGYSNNIISSNTVFSNRGTGIYVTASSTTLVSNNVYLNDSGGFYLDLADDNLLAGNTVRFNGNGYAGIFMAAAATYNNTGIGNDVYGNQLQGIFASSTGANNRFIDGAVGYDAQGNPQPDSGAEITLDPAANPESLILKKVAINPSPGIATAGFNAAANYLVAYSTNAGIVNVYGDYQVSGSTLTLNYAANSYGSSATSPMDMSGHGTTATVTPNDANAVSQLIMLTYAGSNNWTVWGSSSGSMGTITAGSNQNIPSSSVQAVVNITNGGSVAVGDILNFGLIAASQDAGQQKKLYFGPSASGFNHGRSELEIGAGGGFDAEGIASSPTVITMMSGSTYYTFVDSGAFTVNYATFTFMDESGIHLLNSGPFSIQNSTFDYPGSGVGSTSTLITLQNVTNSTITVYGVTYSSMSGNQYNYNYNILGSSTGLSWTQQAYTGLLVGAANTQDDATQQHILWEPVGCSTITSITNGNWSSTNTWNSGTVPTSCNPVYVVSGTTVTLDINNAVASTITITGQLSYKRSGDNELTQVGGNLYVNGGGTLDMGTLGSPITLGTTAYLTLSSGTVAGQYGLIVNPGGNFLVYGAAKQPWTTVTSGGTIGLGTSGVPFTVASAAGWQVGDTITIDTEAVTLTGLSGNQITSISGSLGQVHLSSMPIIVANLSRNVVVRSSGTNTATNTAFLENLVQNATSFNVNYGDFQSLGAGVATKYGIDFESARGSISSSTVRYGDAGVYLNSSNDVLSANNVYANAFDGIDVAGNNNMLTSNAVYANAATNAGIDIISNNNTLVSNLVFDNKINGIIDYTGHNNNLFISNGVYGNLGGGIDIRSNNNTLIADSIYANNNGSGGGFGLAFGYGATGNVCVACSIGYSSAAVSFPDATITGGGVFFFPNAANEGSVFKNTLINPAEGIGPSGFNQPGGTLLNYSPGTLQVYGDYQLSGSTLTLNYANPLYASNATTPADMSGHGTTATVTPNDANAVSQLITLTYAGSNHWTVWGSSSGAMGTITGGSNQNIPSSPVQAVVNITNGGSVAVGDVLNFALIAAAGDAGVQKNLQFAATTGSGFNHDRSEIEIASGAGFDAEGTASSPTVITMLNPGGTYYTFVDSGAFTVNYASFTFMDESGIHLLNSGPFSIQNSTFDYPGSGVGSTSTLITLQNVINSTITVYGVTYSSTSGNQYNYNYNIIGSSTGLSWTQQAYTGLLVGATNTEDDTTQQHILWAPVGCSTITSIMNGNWSSTNTWDAGFVPTACNPVYVISGTTVTLDINTAVASTITITGQLSFKRSGDNELTQTGGNLYVNAGGTLDMGTSGSPITSGTTAYLALSSGTVAQYGLIVNNGGNFLVYGAAKTPWSTLVSPSIIGKGFDRRPLPTSRTPRVGRSATRLRSTRRRRSLPISPAIK